MSNENLIPFSTQLFTIRLNKAERKRYEILVSRALERNPLARPADINRELLGLANYGLFDESDLAYFRGEEEPSATVSKLPELTDEMPAQIYNIR